MTSSKFHITELKIHCVVLRNFANSFRFVDASHSMSRVSIKLNQIKSTTTIHSRYSLIITSTNHIVDLDVSPNAFPLCHFSYSTNSLNYKNDRKHNRTLTCRIRMSLAMIGNFAISRSVITSKIHRRSF